MGMQVGVPAYELAAQIIVAALLLMGICYLPLVMKRELPGWMQLGAISLAIVLAGNVAFAVTTGYWPLRG